MTTIPRRVGGLVRWLPQPNDVAFGVVLALAEERLGCKRTESCRAVSLSSSAEAAMS